MKILILFTGLFALFNAAASSFQECHFEAEMKTMGKTEHHVELKKVLKADGHDKNCDRFLGRQKIKIKNSNALKDSKSFKLKYSHYNAMGPDGVVSSTSWEVIMDKDKE